MAKKQTASETLEQLAKKREVKALNYRNAVFKEMLFTFSPFFLFMFMFQYLSYNLRVDPAISLGAAGVLGILNWELVREMQRRIADVLRSREMLIATWYNGFGDYWANFLLLKRVRYITTQKVKLMMNGSSRQVAPLIEQEVLDYLFEIEDSPTEFDRFLGMCIAPYGKLLKFTPQYVIWKGFFIEANAAPIVLDKVAEYDDYTPVVWVAHSDYHATLIQQSVQSFFAVGGKTLVEAIKELGAKEAAEFKLKYANLYRELEAKEKVEEAYDDRVARGVAHRQQIRLELGEPERKLPRPSKKKIALATIAALAILFFALGWWLKWFTLFW